MRRLAILLGSALALTAGCNRQEASSGNAAANASVNRAAAKAPRHYCFFKKDDSKEWTASRDAKGDVTVKGRVHVRDPRYKGDLGQAEISETSAKFWLTMAPHSSYSSPDDWWDVSATIPNSGSIESVTVACDSKRILAELKVKPRN